MTTTKLLPLRNLMSRKKRKENMGEKSLPGGKIKRWILYVDKRDDASISCPILCVLSHEPNKIWTNISNSGSKWAVPQTAIFINEFCPCTPCNQVMKQSYLIGYWNRTMFFRTGTAEKVELGSTFFRTERNGKFSVHVTHAHAHAHELFCCVPFLSAENFL